MKDNDTNFEVKFDGEFSAEPYLEPYMAQLYGSRGEGTVRGVKLTHQSLTECANGAPYSLTLAVECKTSVLT